MNRCLDFPVTHAEHAAAVRCALSIVVPAYNEAARLPRTLPQIIDFCERRPGTEVLVVDDGSRDQTAEVVLEYARKHSFLKLLRNPGNRGKGYSVRHGMLEAGGEWMLSTDADLSSPLEEIHKLEEAAAKTGAVVAIGSRALDRSLIGVHQAAFREWGGRVFNLAMRAATGLPFKDTQCGFKLFRRDAAQLIFSRQRLDGFGFDVEDLMIARVHGLKVVEVPVVWNNVEGTKVGALSSLRAFADLAVVRWNQLRGRYR